MQPRRVRVADIERLKRTLENELEHPAEEVTTAQAVRMLSSQIHAKGYGLPAIAELLSDNGLTVTATTLRRQEDGRPSQTNGHRPVGTGAAATAPTTGSKPAVEAHAGPGDAQPGARVVAKAAPLATTPPAPTAPAVNPKGTARASDDASSCRSAFVPKEDTRDI